MVQDTVLLAAFGGLVAVLGGAVLRMGWLARRRTEALGNATEAAVGDVDPRSDDRVLVEGTAQVGPGGTIDAPIADTEGMVVTTKVEEYDRNADRRTNSRGSDYNTVGVAEETRTFVVEDDTGSAVVEPPDVTARQGSPGFANLSTTTVKSGYESVPAEPIRSYVEDVVGVSTSESRFRRLQQGVLEPGESVAVLAEPLAVARADTGADVVLGGEADPKLTMLTDKGSDQMRREETTSAAMLLGVGGIMTLIGTGLVVLPVLAQVAELAGVALVVGLIGLATAFPIVLLLAATGKLNDLV